MESASRSRQNKPGLQSTDPVASKTHQGIPKKKFPLKLSIKDARHSLPANNNLHPTKNNLTSTTGSLNPIIDKLASTTKRSNEDASTVEQAAKKQKLETSNEKLEMAKRLSDKIHSDTTKYLDLVAEESKRVEGYRKQVFAQNNEIERLEKQVDEMAAVKGDYEKRMAQDIKEREHLKAKVQELENEKKVFLQKASEDERLRKQSQQLVDAAVKVSKTVDGMPLQIMGQMGDSLKSLNEAVVGCRQQNG